MEEGRLEAGDWVDQLTAFLSSPRIVGFEPPLTGSVLVFFLFVLVEVGHRLGR